MRQTTDSDRSTNANSYRKEPYLWALKWLNAAKRRWLCFLTALHFENWSNWKKILSKSLCSQSSHILKLNFDHQNYNLNVFSLKKSLNGLNFHECNSTPLPCFWDCLWFTAVFRRKYSAMMSTDEFTHGLS